LIITDQAHNAVYQVGLANRAASSVLGQGDLEGVVSAEGDGEYTYAVSKKGIHRVKSGDTSALRMMEASSGWGALSDLQIFGGNVYLLDPTHSQIWKYVPEGTSLGTVKNYVSVDSVVDMTDGVSFSIDGSIWVAKKNGTVVKFIQGKQAPFSVTGLTSELKSLRALYTDETTDYLYLLDDVTSRVVVVQKKDGAYVSNYSSPVFKDAGDVVVDVKGNLLFVLVREKIYKVELREQHASSLTP
jgi:hypothetical protein